MFRPSFTQAAGLALTLSLGALAGCTAGGAPVVGLSGGRPVAVARAGKAAAVAPVQRAEQAAPRDLGAVAAVSALLAPSSAAAVPRATDVGTALALDTSVQALLQDAELLAGNGLVGMDGGLLLSDASARLVGDGGLRYALLSGDDDDETLRKAREGWRGLTEAEREARKALHRKREERVLELTRSGLAQRIAAFALREAASDQATPDGGRIITTKLVAPGGEVVVIREVDAQGVPTRVTLRFTGQVDGAAIDATRVRTFLPDGSVQDEASTRIGTGGEARTLAWTRAVGADGAVTGSGTLKGQDGLAVALTASGNVTVEERVGADVGGLAVAVVRAAGRDEAEVTVRGQDGEERRGVFRATQDARDDDKDDDRDDGDNDADDQDELRPVASPGSKASPAPTSSNRPRSAGDDDDKDGDDDEKSAVVPSVPPTSPRPTSSGDVNDDDDERAGGPVAGQPSPTARPTAGSRDDDDDDDRGDDD
jgi:hypothetical protein